MAIDDAAALRVLNNAGCFVAGTPVLLSAVPGAVMPSRSATVAAQHVAGDEGDAQAITVAEDASCVWAIEDVPLGARVESKNPRPWDYDHSLPQPEAESWAKVSLHVVRGDGAVVDLELLRPNDWLHHYGLVVGRSISFVMPELEINGAATVTGIEACPPLSTGPGSVVTGRFVTYNARSLVRVEFDGGAELIGTSSHPVWSLDRRDWVGLGDLQQHERVAARHGAAVVTSLDSIQQLDTVYNIEVHGEHVYEVTELGVLVHNVNDECFEIQKLLAKGDKLTPDEAVKLERLLSRADTVPTFYEDLWKTLPSNRVGASTYEEFATNTTGWFRKKNSLQSPFSPSADRAQAWKWYQKAKNSTDELVIGEVNQARRFAEKNATGYQRLWAKPWQLQVNDAWVLGGIERGAKFRVVSNINAKSYRRTYLRGQGKYVESVFNRELRLLEQHGYRFVQDPNGPIGTGWMVPPAA